MYLGTDIHTDPGWEGTRAPLGAGGMFGFLLPLPVRSPVVALGAPPLAVPLAEVKSLLQSILGLLNLCMSLAPSLPVLSPVHQ